MILVIVACCFRKIHFYLEIKKKESKILFANWKQSNE